jgi:outer membrane protein assembly factor BamB
MGRNQKPATPADRQGVIMQRRCAGVGIVSLGLGLLAAAPAWALFTRPLPLRDILGDSEMIFVTRVASLDPARPALVLTVEENLKGKAPAERLPIALKGDRDAEQGKHVPQLLKRLAPKLPVVVFMVKNEKEYIAFAYTNGTWFQMTGVPTDDGPRWTFTHCEPYLRRTYKGPTADLRQVVIDVLGGKAKPPPLDDKEKPGLGPEVEEDKPKDADKPAGKVALPPVTGGPLFGLFAPVVGGGLAFLAMLFPAIFGGLILVFRRWMVALSVLSLNSSLYLLQSWFTSSLVDSWWGTSQALWLTMASVTLLGLLWAWRRHAAEPAFHTPGRGEVFMLTMASLGFVVAALWLPRSLARLDLWGKTLVMFAVGMWVSTLHACYLRWVAARRADRRPGVPGEGWLLWSMLVVAVGFGVTFQADSKIADVPSMESSCKVVWRFRPQAERCWIVSSPFTDEDRVYVAAVHPSAFKPSGAVYCLDRRSGRQLWVFNDGGKMKEVFSSPCVAGGRLYVGEGTHQSRDCKLYCLDAVTGKKLWEFQTGSHTESSPIVVGGKVYFGAGDDGLYCLDAADGTEKWHLTGLHVDTNPLVVGGRVYAGSGYNGKDDQTYRDTVLFCLDAETGKEQWRVPTDFSVWGQPVLDGGQLLVGLASGDFMEAGTNPGGAVLCVDAATGKTLWRRDLRDGVLGRVAVDTENVYFASRDGHCYCADRDKGEVRWKTDLEAPIVAAPALVEGAAILYLVTTAGKVVRLNTATGERVWAFEVAADTGLEPLVFSSPAVAPSGGKGDRWRIYFGCSLDSFTRGIAYCLEDAAEGTRP